MGTRVARRTSTLDAQTPLACPLRVRQRGPFDAVMAKERIKELEEQLRKETLRKNNEAKRAGVPDGSRVCSSSHGSLGCFHIIQPIRWAGFGSLIINVDSIQSIFRHFSTTSTTRRYIYSKATTRARAVGYANHGRRHEWQRLSRTLLPLRG